MILRVNTEYNLLKNQDKKRKEISLDINTPPHIDQSRCFLYFRDKYIVLGNFNQPCDFQALKKFLNRINNDLICLLNYRFSEALI